MFLMHELLQAAASTDRAGVVLPRIGLVVVLVWIGGQSEGGP